MFGKNKFPYTNFHELNLDWVLEVAKKAIEAVTKIQEIFTGNHTYSGDNQHTGKETFTGQVVVPSPEYGTDAANKAYVDGEISSVYNDNHTYTGDNTHLGTERFSESVFVPVPEYDSNPTTKKYVDDEVTGLKDGILAGDNIFTGRNQFTQPAVFESTVNFRGRTYLRDGGLFEGDKFRFGAPVEVPDPNADAEAVNKGYVDGQLESLDDEIHNSENTFTAKNTFSGAVEFNGDVNLEGGFVFIVSGDRVMQIKGGNGTNLLNKDSDEDYIDFNGDHYHYETFYDSEDSSGGADNLLVNDGQGKLLWKTLNDFLLSRFNVFTGQTQFEGPTSFFGDVGAYFSCDITVDGNNDELIVTNFNENIVTLGGEHHHNERVQDYAGNFGTLGSVLTSDANGRLIWKSVPDLAAEIAALIN